MGDDGGVAVGQESALGAGGVDGRQQARPVGVVGKHEPAVDGSPPAVPRIRIQPEAKPVETGPNLRIQGVPWAEGGAMMRDRDQSVFGPPPRRGSSAAG